MLNVQAKRLRKMAEAANMPVEDNYEATRTNNQFGRTTTVVLAECQKALYREMKKSLKKEGKI